MVGSEIKNLSLVELYGHPPINYINFVRLIHEIDVSDLVRKYKELMKVAPRRHKRRKKYFVEDHDGKLKGEKKSNRKEEHLAVALFNECRNGKEFLLSNKRKLKIIDYQVPLKAERDDIGIGKIDLFGVIDKEIPCAIELKVDQDSGGKPDTPLRALLEGLTYCAIIERNKKDIWKEAQDPKNGGFNFKGSRPHLMVLAPSNYWNYYFEKKPAGDWPSSLIGLANKLSQQLEIQILFYSLENAEFEWGGNGKPAKMKKECKFLSLEPLE